MNNIYTEIETILTTDKINEEYECSELSDSPIISIMVSNREVTTFSEDLSEDMCRAVVLKYSLNRLLPEFNIDLSLIGYVVSGEFFLFSVFQQDELVEMSPSRRASFIELFNTNKDGIVLRHVPVFDYVLTFPGAQRALKNGSKFSDVSRYTIQAITEQCEGISPMTKLPRKGLVFKSLQSNYSFKCFSEATLQNMGGV